MSGFDYYDHVRGSVGKSISPAVTLGEMLGSILDVLADIDRRLTALEEQPAATEETEGA